MDNGNEYRNLYKKTTEMKAVSRKYWISNEGTVKNPKYHVWKTGITHSACDSAYNDLSLAIARANYLNAKEKQ